MKTYVEFRSSRFPPYEDGSDEVNPGVFGKRLAEFMKEGLARKGLKPDEIIAEDWGYIIPLENDRFNLWVGCANIDETVDRFLCFIEPDRPVVYRYWFFGKIDTTQVVEKVHRAMDEWLTEHDGVFEKKWSTRGEFHAR